MSFLLAEIPSQLISKKLGPDRWIPSKPSLYSFLDMPLTRHHSVQMIAWSIVAAAQAALSGKGSFYACRALIGMLEGGFIPDLVLW